MLSRLFALLLGFCLFACQQPAAYDLEGKVVKVADGDTFTLLDADNQQVRVRLHGIDCPERAQPYGNVARQYLSTLVFGKQVGVEEMDTDRYGRVVGIVHVDGKVVNEELLKEGLAWHYTEYDDNPDWARLQADARRQGRGLWQDKRPVEPWNWRKRGRKEPARN